MIKLPGGSGASGSLDERTFISADSFIEKDRWSYCAIRWGGPKQENCTGSFYINGKNAGSFGPIAIQSGVTVTVGSGETWTVV